MKKDPLPVSVVNGEAIGSGPYFLGSDHPGTHPTLDMRETTIEQRHGVKTETGGKKRRKERREGDKKRNTIAIGMEKETAAEKDHPQKSEKTILRTSCLSLSMS